MRKRSAAEIVVDILVGEGVRHVFGVPGGPVLGLCDAIERRPGISFVLTRHEQAAAYAAFGHARTTGELGVCLATLGPGATNLLSGLPVAAVESAPVLAITGQVQDAGIARGGHQESSGWFGTPDQHAMFAATCKHSATCTDPGRLPQFLRHAIRIARSGRPGPAHLILPSGVLHARIEDDDQPPSAYRLLADHRIDRAAAARIAARIQAACAPVILLGGRAFQPACGTAAEALAEAAAAPLVADLSCKSVVDERHPHYLGVLGVLGHRGAERYVKEAADLILSVGQTFDEITTLAWDPALSQGRIIQLDVCPEEIGKAFPVSDASVGHLPSLLDEIRERLTDLAPADRRRRMDVIAQARSRDPPFVFDEARSDRQPMPPQRVVADLRLGLPDEAIVLTDSSKWARWIGRYFQATRDQVVSAHDYEPMGWSIPAAIAVKLARPERPVVCVSGDGAFLMSAMELSTAANHGVKVVFLVMNDERLGIIYDLQKALFDGRVAGTTFRNPDLPALAAAFGLRGERIEHPGALPGALAAAFAADTSTVLDVRFDPDEIPAVRPRSLLITKGMGLPDPTPGPETTRALIKLLKER